MCEHCTASSHSADEQHRCEQQWNQPTGRTHRRVLWSSLVKGLSAVLHERAEIASWQSLVVDDFEVGIDDLFGIIDDGRVGATVLLVFHVGRSGLVELG